jgi:regulator of protease activity HflC (stomatin/prohibitin superfamily)
MDNVAYVIWALAGAYFALKFIRSFRVVPNQTELIVERLGSYHQTLGPGFHPLIPFIDKVAFTIDLKEFAIEVPPQECFTHDNVRVEVDGVLYMKVTNAKLAAYGVTDYGYAAVQMAQTTVRAVIGTLDLDKTFEERENINSRVVSALNEVGQGWGLMVSRYEVKNIVPPPSVRDAMERQMAAERDRRALLARAEGEKQARINDSEGKKQEMINRSQGEMQRRINEAEGKAEEILAIAKATADSIRVTASTLSESGGNAALNLRLTQQMIAKIGNLSAGQKVVLPADLMRVDDLLKGLGLHEIDQLANKGSGGPTGQLVRPPREREAVLAAPRPVASPLTPPGDT